MKTINNLVFTGLFLISVAFCFSQTSYAQEIGKSKLISGEVYLGTRTPLLKLGAQKNMLLGPSVGLEIRYGFSENSPWDIGLGSKAGIIKRYYSEGAPAYVSSEHYLAIDYKVRLNPSLVFFAGIEGGVSVGYDMSFYNDYATLNGNVGQSRVDTHNFYVPKSLSPYIAARAGIEAWSHLRVSLSCEICDKGYSNVGLHVGYVF